MGDAFDLEQVLRYGVLPQVQAEPTDAIDTLDAYVANYVREEVLQEALVRNLESFARFLEVAALMNGQVLNVAGIARDAAVARPTVQGYFATLVDTLIGCWLPAWRKRAKVKEVASPKFYFFDRRGARLGGACARASRARRARIPARNPGAERTAGGPGVPEPRRATALLAHAVRQRGRLRLDARTRAVGIEVERLRPSRRRDHGAALKALVEGREITSGPWCLHGSRELKDGPLRVWPVRRFLETLTAGDDSSS